MNIEFEPNTGWLWRWQRRENISLKKIQGESASNDIQSANNYVHCVLPQLLQDYDLCDIFNADESGLFYKALPSSTLNRQGWTLDGTKLKRDI